MKKSSEPPEETTPPLVIEPAGPEEGTEFIVKHLSWKQRLKILCKMW